MHFILPKTCHIEKIFPDGMKDDKYLYYGTIDLKRWTLTRNKDNTVTINPSIRLSEKYYSDDYKHCDNIEIWHGFLINNMWCEL
jgi:hypothetical protein